MKKKKKEKHRRKPKREEKKSAKKTLAYEEEIIVSAKMSKYLHEMKIISEENERSGMARAYISIEENVNYVKKMPSENEEKFYEENHREEWKSKSVINREMKSENNVYRRRINRLSGGT